MEVLCFYKNVTNPVKLRPSRSKRPNPRVSGQSGWRECSACVYKGYAVIVLVIELKIEKANPQQPLLLPSLPLFISLPPQVLGQILDRGCDKKPLCFLIC